jgi:hypothetical protein
MAGVLQVSLLGSREPVKWTRAPQGMVFELPGGKPEKFLGLALKLEGKGTPTLAVAGPAETKPPVEQDQMERLIRKHLAGFGGKAADEKQNDALQQQVPAPSGNSIPVKLPPMSFTIIEVQWRE